MYSKKSQFIACTAKKVNFSYVNGQFSRCKGLYRHLTWSCRPAIAILLYSARQYTAIQRYTVYMLYMLHMYIISLIWNKDNATKNVYV